MPTKKKHINKLTIALVRVLTLFSIFFVLWLSFFWAEQKYTFNKPTLLINGTSILSHTYYTGYLVNSIEVGNTNLKPNKILDELYKHPYIEAARLSYRYPDKIIIIGGGNARSQMQVFFDAGADLICLSEAEETIVEIAELIISCDVISILDL